MKKAATLNYRSQLISRIKKKYLYLILGTLILTSLSTVLLFYSLPHIELVRTNMQKKEQPTVASAQDKSTNYKVQEGDQLWLISEKFYGSGLNTEDILRANNLTNPDLIEVGQTLIIPSVRPRIPTVGEIESGTTTGKVKTAGETYVVKEGDSLSSIALLVYGDMYAWEKIARANNFSNSADVLEVGKILIIPR